MADVAETKTKKASADTLKHDPGLSGIGTDGGRYLQFQFRDGTHLSLQPVNFKNDGDLTKMRDAILEWLRRHTS